ncbi:MAG: molybdate ABC transporter substrate-binding protein [Clostridia bacterium]
MISRKLIASFMAVIMALTMTACSTQEQEVVAKSITSSDVATNEDETGISSITDLATDKVSLVALGNDDVPVGRYAKELLENMDLWGDVESKVSYASNVKEVLTQVEMSVVDCGIVYSTDALTSDDVQVIEVLDSSYLETPVVYPATKLFESQNQTQADCFLAYLTSEFAQDTFFENGFTVTADTIEPQYTELEPCTLTVFAAASLTESLTILTETFEDEYENVDFIISFDSSGTLATQIEYGAEVDIFISASTSEVDRLIDENYIDEADSFYLLENELVLITAK